MPYNLQLILFRSFETVKEFYSTIVENIPKIKMFIKFPEYFEYTWFSINDNENTSIYEYSLWNYSSKIKFKGTKTSLFKEGEIDKYIFFKQYSREF